MENTDISAVSNKIQLDSESDLIVDDWAIRSAYWNNKSQLEIPKRKRREKAKTGLVLTGHGLSISVDKGRLFIRDGFTHYPQKPISKTYFKGSLDIPPRIVLVDGEGSITLDALDWLAEQKVDLIRLRYDGRILTAICANGYAADPQKVARQILARESDLMKVEFATPLVRQKFIASIQTLSSYLPQSKSTERAITAATECLRFIDRGHADTTQKLRGQEGKAASQYWNAWHQLDMKWQATNRFPVPDEWRRYKSRSSLNSRRKEPNRNASHPVNAMLNYSYGMLLARMHIQAVADGYDPTIGVMHDQREKQKASTASYALDLMEPHRPVVDRIVLKLIREETFSGADFELQSDGVCRLNPELVKMLVAE